MVSKIVASPFRCWLGTSFFTSLPPSRYTGAIVNDYTIRQVRQEDLYAVVEITNHYIRNFFCIMRERDEQIEERNAWLMEKGDRYLLYFAVRDEDVVGWGGLSPHSERTAYRHTVHDAVHVRQDLRGQGIGSALLERLTSVAKELRYHSIIAVVVSDNPAPIALHHRYGFRDAGCLRQVGHKFGQWIRRDEHAADAVALAYKA